VSEGPVVGRERTVAATESRQGGVRSNLRTSTSLWLRSILEKTPSSGAPLVQLDGLRGLAVLIVVASHTQALGMWGQGAMGVWLFFVLSSFLLTRILLLKQPVSLTRVELQKYVVRRIARILPLYYVVLAIVSLSARRNLRWFVQHATFQRADGHFWSIPQEELFYVLLPIFVGCLVWMGRILPRVPMVGVAAALLVAVLLSHPLLELNGNGTKLPFYLNVFCVGFFLSVAWPTKRFSDLRASAVFVRVANGLGFVVVPAILLTAPAHLKGYGKVLGISETPSLEFVAWQYPAISAGLCAVLLVLALTLGTWLSRVSAWAPLRLVGVLSFSVYLVHPFVIDGLTALGVPGVGAVLFLLTLLVSLAVGLVLERVLERPCMAFGRRLNSRF
jgi:peptidoglycan/LPS O-acetylase OafA/YrhL